MQLLEHFKELTLHPKNAEELKGLILQLAVKGKLTQKWREENPDVEPAYYLLKQIAKEKERLVKEKIIKKEKPLTGIEEAEIPYSLPKGWEWCKLGNSGYTQTGSTPTKNDSTNYGDFIPFLGPGDISNQWMKYPTEGLSKKGIKIGRLIPKGSLMMVCIGGSIGKCNINEKDVSCNQQINTVTPLIIPPDYIKIVCQAPFFQNEVLSKSSGSATPIINKGKWENIIFPLPPLAEQKAIVEVVNQLFAEVEQLEALTKERIQLKADFVTSALNQLTQAYEHAVGSHWELLKSQFGTFFTEKANIKKLRESILQLAVQGKLTHHWRSLRQAQGPPLKHASVLLEKIKAEKEQLIKAGKIKKEKSLPPLSDDEIPYDLPEGWAWCRLGDLSEFINGDRGKNYPNKDEYVDEGIAWINTGHIEPNGTLSKNRMNYITRKKFESLNSGKIKEGDMVYCLRGATFGKTAFVTPFFEGAIASSLMIIRTYLNDTSQYIFNFLMSPEGKRQLFRFDNGSAQPNLSANNVKLYLFPLAPLEEQKAIVEKVNGLMVLCDQLEQEIETHQTTQEKWMKSCLREVVKC